MYRMRWSYADLYNCPYSIVGALIDIMQKDNDGNNSR